MQQSDFCKNKLLKAILIRVSALFTMAILILLFLVVKHTQIFPVIYLNDQREKELIDFSEMILKNVDNDISFHRSGSLHRNIESGHEIQQEIIKEMYRFCETNDFLIINVSVDENLVLYRHHIVLHYVTDYTYRKQSGNSEITIRSYKR